MADATRTRLGPPRVPRPAALAAAAGDVTAISAFLGVGLLAHAINPLAFPRHAALTALPFLLAWAVVAPLSGVYGREIRGDLRALVPRVTVVWTVTSLLGAGLRATPMLPGDSPPTFLLVNVGIGLAFLLPWRLAFAVGIRRFEAK
ncbi:DUF3054 domain-containing protein [Haloparvum sedimenti]|uniref:DUF3054 domain-containing protein n=1 Tax=Haloparvum sedimenti TaxID=1678448 RepID=UPI00071E9285|nr:DUF3054 domain-containing protein [Haloparvum sedimenti]